MNNDASVCALCQQSKTLLDSHVVPRFFLRAATTEISTGKRIGKRETSVVHFGDNPGSKDFQEGAFERKQGLVKKLFCACCEGKIGKWETYARGVLYGNSPGPEIRKRVLSESVLHLFGPQNAKTKYLRDVRQVHVDYKKFKLFELSILWRAGLEKKSWGKQVELGPFQEELRVQLLNENPGPTLYLPVIIVDLQDKDIAFEGMVPAVELLTKKPFHLYRAILGGYCWLFSVSKNFIHTAAGALAVQESGDLRIIEAEGRPVVEQFVELFRQIKPDGEIT